MSQTLSVFDIRPSYFFFKRFPIIVSSKKNWSKISSIDCTLINHNRIFLVISWVASDCNNRITSRRKFFEMKISHRFCFNKRSLRIIQNMRQSIHSYLIIRAIYPNSLFSHRTLICISWGLVMIWEWNNWGTNS